MMKGYSAQVFIITLKENGSLLENDSEIKLDNEMGVAIKEGIAKIITEVSGSDKGKQVENYLNSLDENIKYSVSYQVIGTSIEDYFYFRIDQFFIVKITTHI